MADIQIAIDRLTRAARTYPWSVRYRAGMAMGLFDVASTRIIGLEPTAYEAIRRAIEADPYYAPLYAMAAVMGWRSGRCDIGNEAFAKYRQFRPAEERRKLVASARPTLCGEN